MDKLGYILGVFCYGSHDSAIACISPEGSIIYAAEEERFDRIKHSSNFPTHAIENLFSQYSLNWSNISQIGFAWDPYLDLTKSAFFVAKQIFHSKQFLFHKKQKTPSRIEKWKNVLSAKKKFCALGFRGQFHYLSHHLCHASSAHFSSGKDSSSCLTVDGNAEFATTTIHHFSASGHTQLWRACYPHSLGHFYSTITQYLGFWPMNDEYKVMGLSSYEKTLKTRTEKNPFDKILLSHRDHNFSLNLDYFLFHKGSDKMWSPQLEKLLGPSRKKEAPIEPRHEQIAFYAQAALEAALLNLVKKAKHLTNESNLSIAGGVGLNCVANQKIFNSNLFETVFFQPAAHDSGTALGAAQYLWAKTHKKNPIPPKNYCLGPKFIPAGQQMSTAKRLTEKDLLEKVCELLLQEKVVAWYQGGMEFGPRALGSRSLLALPQNRSIRDKLNLIIKKRESFRPFAPVVLEEEAEQFFMMNGTPSPFMMRTVNIRPHHIPHLQAIAHVDGTARVQTVTREQNSRLYALLKLIGEKTSYPILLNTSLNRNHEPIACNPEEAIAIFKDTDVDALAMENYLFSK